MSKKDGVYSDDARPLVRQIDRLVLLAVDDETDNLDFVTRVFRKDFDVRHARSGEDALRMTGEILPDIIIADHKMPGMSGIQFLIESVPVCPEAIRVLLTGFAELELAIQSINEGHVFRFLTKPVASDHLRHTVEDAVAMKRLENQSQNLLALAQHRQRQLEIDLDRTRSMLSIDDMTGLPNVRALRTSLELTEKQRAIAIRFTSVPAGPWLEVTDQLNQTLRDGATDIGVWLYRIDGMLFVALGEDDALEEFSALVRSKLQEIDPKVTDAFELRDRSDVLGEVSRMLDTAT